MRAPGRLGTKEGRSQATFGTLSLKADSTHYPKGHPFCVFTNTKLFSNSLGKKIPWLPSVVSDCPTFKESTSPHSHFSPSHLVQLCGDGELSSLLLGPPHGWGSIPVSCLFFDRTMLSSPFPGPNFQIPPLPLTSNTVEKVLSLLLNCTSRPLLIFFSPTPFMVEDLAQKLTERRVLTQDEWHSKDGYKEDIHSGFCTSALKVKKEITAFPTKLTPPSALLQSREGAAATLLPGGGIPRPLAD